MNDFKAAIIPDELVPAFSDAEKMIKDFFNSVEGYPDKGRIVIRDLRYMWVSAVALATSFRDTLEEVYGPKGTDQILYKFGKSVGKMEAKGFHKKFGLEDPIAKLAAGPVYFSYSGWAFVHILPQSAPQANEDYLLTYIHPNSFEAEAANERGVEYDRPICYINAGYSAGWCEESFGIPLEAREITCEAKGDKSCTFFMTHRAKFLPRLNVWDNALKQDKEPTIEELLSA